MVDEQLSGGSPAGDAQTPDSGSSEEAKTQGQAQVESSAPESTTPEPSEKSSRKPKRNDADARVAEVQRAYEKRIQEEREQAQAELRKMQYEFEKRLAPEEQHGAIEAKRLQAERDALQQKLQRLEQQQQEQEAKRNVAQTYAEELSDTMGVDLSPDEIMGMIEEDDSPTSLMLKALRHAADQQKKAQKAQKRAQHAQVDVGSGATPDLDPVKDAVSKAQKGQTNYRSVWAAALTPKE